MSLKKTLVFCLILGASFAANAQQPATNTPIQPASMETQRDGIISSSTASHDVIACQASDTDPEMCTATAMTGNKKVTPALYAAHAGFKKVYRRSVGLSGGIKFHVLEVGN